MSCWVVPALAAELWGMPLNTVMEKIHNRSIPSKTELGFLLVDALPDKPAGSNKPRPLTYVPVVREVTDAPPEQIDWEKRKAVGRLRTPPAQRRIAA